MLDEHELFAFFYSVLTCSFCFFPALTDYSWVQKLSMKKSV